MPSVDRENVTTAIAVGRSVTQSDDAEAAQATVSLARRAGPDAVKFLRRVIVTEGGWASVPQRVRASCAVLEVGGFIKSSGPFRETEATDGAGERDEP